VTKKCVDKNLDSKLKIEANVCVLTDREIIAVEMVEHFSTSYSPLGVARFSAQKFVKNNFLMNPYLSQISRPAVLT
jgi:hypothetical protein